nr:aldolase/citrate lyase family protein [Serratia marcescens]
ENDIKAMVKAGIDVIRLPKTENADMIHELENLVEAAEKEFGREVGSTHLMAAIESAMGVVNAYEIASASDRMIGIALSAEDYTTDMKTHRYPDGQELLYARNAILHAARAAKIAAFDTVFTNLDDEEGFIRETKLIHQLGFDGKSLINPRQIAPVNKVYAPTQKEILNAQNVMAAIEEAKRKGSGVIAMNGQMVDRPVVLRAERVMMLAKANNLIDPTKVALLIFNQFHNHSNTHYSVYMGDRDKIVVVDDGEGGLASSSVAKMYTDNHDGSYSYATIESSATAFSDYTPSNSYWKTVGSVNVSEMLAIYQSRVNEVNQLTNLLDLSKSTQSFTFLPTNQTTAP